MAKKKIREIKEVRSSSPSNEKMTKELTYTADAYCNIIGAQDGIRYVANLKFRGADKKTIKEWKESFKKEALI